MQILRFNKLWPEISSRAFYFGIFTLALTFASFGALDSNWAYSIFGVALAAVGLLLDFTRTLKVEKNRIAINDKNYRDSYDLLKPLIGQPELLDEVHRLFITGVTVDILTRVLIRIHKEDPRFVNAADLHAREIIKVLPRK